jgi:hypothetical protein
VQGLSCPAQWYQLLPLIISLCRWKYCRCGVPSCAICLRTCTSDSGASPRLPGALNLPLDSNAFPFSLNNKNTSSLLRRRRPRDEDSDGVLKTKEVGDGRAGCGQVVCRTCCFEHPQRSEPIKPSISFFTNIQNVFAIDDSGAVACLDCSEEQGVLQTHDSDASIHGELNPDHNLIVSS